MLMTPWPNRTMTCISAMCLTGKGAPDGALLESWLSMGIMGIEAVPGKFLLSWPDVDMDEVHALGDFIRSVGMAIPAMQGILFGKPHAKLFDAPDAFGKEIISVARVAEALGCSRIILGAPAARKRGDTPLSEAMQRAADTLWGICPDLREAGVTLLIEHVSKDYGCDFLVSPAEVSELVREVAHPSLGLHLDVGGMSGASDLEFMGQSGHVHASEPGLAPFVASSLHESAASRARDMSKPWVSLEMLPHPDGMDGVMKCARAFSDIYGHHGLRPIPRQGTIS